MAWKFPSGILCEEMLTSLSIKLVTPKEILSHLMLVKEQIYARGLNVILSINNFGVICSAIYHFSRLNAATKEFLWEVIDLLYR